MLAGWVVTTTSADCVGKDAHNLYYSRVFLSPPAAVSVPAIDEKWPWDPLATGDGNLIVETGDVVAT